MMRVLFIGKRFYTNRDALLERYGRIYQLPHYWARQGLNVRLWLIDYHGRQRVRQTLGALHIDSTPLRGTAWLAVTLSFLASRLRSSRPTHIVASGDAYIGLLGWLLARWTGAHFVFDVYDKYDEFTGYRKLLRWDLFGFLLRRSDQCWFASRRLLGLLGNIPRGDALVMNGIDRDHFTPHNMEAARQRLGLPTAVPLVGYFGALSLERGLPDLIEAMQVVRRIDCSVELILAGKTDADIELKAPGVHYLGNLSHEQVPWALAAVDVVAVPYRRSAFLDAASSIKFGEIMACKRPLVATRTPNLLDNFPAQSAELDAYLAPPQNPAALADAIVRQLRDQKRVDPPAGMEWAAIANEALSSLTATRQNQAVNIMPRSRH
jgi:glycosyltransferase involved in cell wall biosynthesis